MSPCGSMASFVLNKWDVLRKTRRFLIIICSPDFFHILIFHPIKIFYSSSYKINTDQSVTPR